MRLRYENEKIKGNYSIEKMINGGWKAHYALENNYNYCIYFKIRGNYGSNSLLSKEVDHSAL